MAVFYVCCFILSYSWLFFNGLLLHQLRPVFFINRLDLSLNILFLTGLQHAVTENFAVQLFLDLLYLAMPLFLLLTVNRKIQPQIALLNIMVNAVYALVLSAVSPLSMEGFVGWILLPMIFLPVSEKGFYYILHCIRYIFLLIFLSAGIWKLRAGGLFNTGQMSAILLVQHAAYITQGPHDWFSSGVNYLVLHSRLSYLLYLVSFFAELFFAVGFFTKKYDRILIVVFLLFVFFDLLVMKINYFSWLAFLGCLWFSKYQEPGLTGFKPGSVKA